jgi:ATP-dependent DNA ligase
MGEDVGNAGLRLPAGFIAPCLPTKTGALPSGGLWVHEIKHDGLRIIARKTGAQVKLYSRPGNDLTGRFPLIVKTLADLRTPSCIIDGEAVACDENGLAVFERLEEWARVARMARMRFESRAGKRLVGGPDCPCRLLQRWSTMPTLSMPESIALA